MYCNNMTVYSAGAIISESADYMYYAHSINDIINWQ